MVHIVDICGIHFSQSLLGMCGCRDNVGYWGLGGIVSSGKTFRMTGLPQLVLFRSSLLSSRGRIGPSLISKNGLVVTQGFVILKPASFTVMSRFSGKWEGSVTVYSRYS